MPKKRIDYTGMVFGNLVVLRDAPTRKNFARYLVCKCVCGEIIEVHLSNLKKEYGGTRSCGCIGKHYGTATRLHSIWSNMKQRCYNPNHTNYKHYGAIGVTVCDEWKDDFVSFRDWALKHGYQDALSIDRIAGALSYSPETCQWATQEMQTRNQRARENTSSKYKGVCFFKRTQQWIAYVTVNGKRIHLGYFSDEIDAARARDAYIQKEGLQNFVLNGG